MESPASPASPWGRPSSRASRDWARHGHADAARQLTSVYRAEPPYAPATPAVARHLSRRARRTVGTLLLVVVALGSAGSAVALRDALFPDTGDAATRSVWQNPGHERSPDRVDADTSIESTSTSAPVHSPTVSVATTAVASTSSTSPDPAGSAGVGAVDQQVTFDDGSTSSGTVPASGTLPGSDDDDDDDAGHVTSTTSGRSGSSESAPTTADDDSSGSGGGSDDSDNSGSGSGGSGDGGSGSGDSGSHGSGSGSDDDESDDDDGDSGSSGSGSDGD